MLPEPSRPSGQSPTACSRETRIRSPRDIHRYRFEAAASSDGSAATTPPTPRSAASASARVPYLVLITGPEQDVPGSSGIGDGPTDRRTSSRSRRLPPPAPLPPGPTAPPRMHVPPYVSCRACPTARTDTPRADAGFNRTSRSAPSPRSSGEEANATDLDLCGPFTTSTVDSWPTSATSLADSDRSMWTSTYFAHWGRVSSDINRPGA